MASEQSPRTQPPREPLLRRVEKDAGEESSPMDPPDAYAPPATESIPEQELHPFLRGLLEDHRRILGELSNLEDAIQQIQTDGFSPALAAAIREFFVFFDEAFARHSAREEEHLYPQLRQRLIEVGEHSAGPERHTGVDVLRGDHERTVRRAAVACAFTGLAFRLRDEESALTALASGVQQCRGLIEDLRLHIFREEQVSFGQAQRLLGAEALDRIASMAPT